jgi:lipopolysaccharide export system ATP-binding protein
VALAGLACAGMVYVSFGHRKPPSGGPPIQPVDPATTSQSPAGRLTRTKDGRNTIVIDYANRTTYSDGRVRFGDAHMQSFDERGVEMWADSIDTSGKATEADNPGELSMTGHVRFTTKDGLEARMDRATYNDATSLLTTPGHLTFTKKRMSGEGDGSTYDQKQDVLTLLDHAHINIAPDGGTGAVDATSARITLVRPARVVRLDHNARIVRDGDTLSGDDAVLHLTDDESKLKNIELRNHAQVTPGTGRDSSGPPNMRADDIDLTLHADGQTIRSAGLVGRSAPAVVDLASETGHRVISSSQTNLELAPDGQTLTRLDAREKVSVELPPQAADKGARTIHADTLHAEGKEPAGLTSARFDGRPVEYGEVVPPRNGTPASIRTVTSNGLTLKLNGQLDAIDSAQFEADVSIKDADGSAGAELATYDPDKGRMYLKQGADKTKPTPFARNNDGRTVLAQEIDLHLDSNDLDARIGVVTTAKPARPASGRPQSPMFSADEVITGRSAELKYVGNLATYTGTPTVPARLRQTQRSVTGQTIEFNSDTNDLRANGGVESVMISDQSKTQPNAAPAQYRIEKADSLVYVDAKRIAKFEGAKLHVQSADGTTTARMFQVTFKQDSGDVQKLLWDGDVDARLTNNRHGVGDRLTYDADTEVYVLTGKPAQALLPKAEGSATCSLMEGDTLTLNRTSNAGQGGLTDANLPCDTPLPHKVTRSDLMATLRTEGLTKSYGGRTVVRNINLNVSSGEIVGLLGPNGAGKTTTFSMVVGLTGADAGQVLLDNERVTADPMYIRARKGIGYLPQEPSVFRGLTVEKNVLAILETQPLNTAQRRQRLAALLEELNLTPLARAKAHTLSGGERRRVEITRALVNQPKFMLLDEPFAGIDPIAVGDIQKIIFHLRDRGIGVLITDHNVRETLKITDRAYIVHDGSIFRSGTPASLAADEEVKRIYLGADFRLD